MNQNTKQDGEITPFITAEIVEEPLDFNTLAYQEFRASNPTFVREVEDAIKWNLIGERNDYLESLRVCNCSRIKSLYAKGPSGSWARNHIAFPMFAADIIINKVPEWFPNGEMLIFSKIDIEIGYDEHHKQFCSTLWLYPRDSYCKRFIEIFTQ